MMIAKTFVSNFALIRFSLIKFISRSDLVILRPLSPWIVFFKAILKSLQILNNHKGNLNKTYHISHSRIPIQISL